MKTKTKIKRKWGKVKSYYKVNRGALWFAFIAGIIAAIILINSLFNAPKTSPQPLGQTIEVKAVEVTTPKIPCDYDAITYIRCRGQQLGYKDTDISVFVRIARAESNFNPLAKNKSSTATGIYQFINGTFHRYCAGKNVYNFVDNIDCFYKVLETDGYPKALNHWNASRSKWEK